MHNERDIAAGSEYSPHWDRSRPPQYRPRRRSERHARGQSRGHAHRQSHGRGRTTHRGAATALVAVVTLLLLGAGAVIAVAAFAPVPVTVEGNAVRLPAGSTVARAVELGVARPQPGVVHAVDGSVIATATGAPGAVLVNGSAAALTTRLHWRDKLATVAGAPTTETVLERNVEVPYKTVKQGFGEKKRVVRKGKNGLKVEQYGALSGMVVSAKTVRKPVNKLVELTGGSAKSGEKVVALTFDDGPWNSQTTCVLDILDRYGIKATFFMLGTRVTADPKTAAKVAKRGHVLGNHSFSHPDLTKQSASAVRSQVQKTSAAIKKATGQSPKWFRAPGGAMDSTARGIVEANGMQVAHWTVGTGDWKNLGSARVVKYALTVKPGGVILMHDGGGDRDQTIEALPQVIEKLRDRGYRFVTLDQLPSVPGNGSGSY